MFKLTESPPESKSVVMVGPIPPPISGQAKMNVDVGAALRSRTTVRMFDTAGDFATRDLPYYLARAKRTWRAMLGVRRHRRAGKTVYMSAEGGPGIILNVLVALAARVSGCRTFLHHHSFAYITAYNRWEALLVRVMGRQGVHIVLSPIMNRQLRQRYPALSRTMELGAASMVPVVTRAPWTLRTPATLGFLSNLIIEKGVDTVIALAREARNRGLPVRLLLAGRILDEAGAALVQAASAELGDAFEFRGPLSEDEKHSFFMDIDVFVFPTRYVNEAQPRVVNEALAYGIPVLTTAIGCLPDVVDSGCGACIAPDGDFVAHALPVLTQWLDNPESHAAVSAQAVNRATRLHELGERQFEALCSALVE